MTPYYPARDGYPSMFDLLNGTRAAAATSQREHLDFANAQARSPNHACRASNAIPPPSRSPVRLGRPPQNRFASDEESARGTQNQEEILK